MLMPDFNGEILNRIKTGSVGVLGVKIVPIIWTDVDAIQAEAIQQITDFGAGIWKGDMESFADKSVGWKKLFLYSFDM